MTLTTNDLAGVKQVWHSYYAQDPDLITDRICQLEQILEGDSSHLLARKALIKVKLQVLRDLKKELRSDR